MASCSRCWLASRARSATALLVGAILSAASTAAGSTPVPAVTPNPRIQAAIERAATARSAADLDAALRKLAALGGPANRELIAQLIVFARTPHDARTAMAPGVIRERLGITNEQLVDALVPLLDTADAAQRAQVANWLGGVDTAGDGTRDFSVYRSRIAEQRNTPPPGLLRYMYETDAPAALLVVADVYGDPVEVAAVREIRRPVDAAWSGKRTGQPLDAAQIAAARAALATLARHPDWWVRAYAAASLAQLPPLRAQDLADAMRADPQPLVRELAPRMNADEH